MIITQEVRNRFRDFIAFDGQRPPDSHISAMVEVLGGTAVSQAPHYTFRPENGTRWENYVATERGIVYVHGDQDEKPQIEFHSWASIGELRIIALDPINTGNIDQPDFRFRYEIFSDRATLQMGARAEEFITGVRQHWQASGNPNAY